VILAKPPPLKERNFVKKEKKNPKFSQSFGGKKKIVHKPKIFLKNLLNLSTFKSSP